MAPNNVDQILAMVALDGEQQRKVGQSRRHARMLEHVLASKTPASTFPTWGVLAAAAAMVVVAIGWHQTRPRAVEPILAPVAALEPSPAPTEPAAATPRPATATPPVAHPTVEPDAKAIETEAQQEQASAARWRSRTASTQSKRAKVDVASLRTTTRPEPPSKTWLTFAQAGRYRQAMEALGDEEFRQLCTQLDARSLLELADAARYARRSPRARRALMSLRQRFPKSSQASTAAFDLGRLQAGSDCETAERWFRTYLHERPQGSMAAEARRRLSDCSHATPK